MGLLLNVPHCSFSNVIPEMGIYSTVGDVLLVLLAVSYDGIVHKAAIVAMVMLKMHTMTFGKTLKAFLAMTVSSEFVPVMRCIYHSLEKWSKKMVAALYFFLVNFPLS